MNSDFLPADSDDFVDAWEEFERHKRTGDEWAYTSSWGEANPGGGKDKVEDFLLRSKKEVVLATESLGKLVKMLQLPELEQPRRASSLRSPRGVARACAFSPLGSGWRPDEISGGLQRLRRRRRPAGASRGLPLSCRAAGLPGGGDRGGLSGPRGGGSRSPRCHHRSLPCLIRLSPASPAPCLCASAPGPAPFTGSPGPASLACSLAPSSIGRS
ncbi:unnamed protein product [Prorocentrum cordatum]|uniref:Uncharacterized protein n=1 Tax=Prorocentrum cordatum TaxID=2364126 RepID=A0ABN9TSW3_9DINO|nr:unnamed protein product [Polarella glacialis]